MQNGEQTPAVLPSESQIVYAGRTPELPAPQQATTETVLIGSPDLNLSLFLDSKKNFKCNQKGVGRTPCFSGSRLGLSARSVLADRAAMHHARFVLHDLGFPLRGEGGTSRGFLADMDCKWCNNVTMYIYTYEQYCMC